MNPLTLNEVQIDEIRKLAADERRFLGFVGETPVANDIFSYHSCLCAYKNTQWHNGAYASLW